MKKESAVEAIRRLFLDSVSQTGEPWQVEIGENMSLLEFFAGTSVAMPAAFISYGSFTADKDVFDNGVPSDYEETVVMYLLRMGDMWTIANRFRHHVNEGRNRFFDIDGIERGLQVRTGDGIRLQSDGIPAFEITIGVVR